MRQVKNGFRTTEFTELGGKWKFKKQKIFKANGQHAMIVAQSLSVLISKAEFVRLEAEQELRPVISFAE